MRNTTFILGSIQDQRKDIVMMNDDDLPEYNNTVSFFIGVVWTMRRSVREKSDQKTSNPDDDDDDDDVHDAEETRALSGPIQDHHHAGRGRVIC